VLSWVCGRGGSRVGEAGEAGSADCPGNLLAVRSSDVQRPWRELGVDRAAGSKGVFGWLL